MRLTSQRRPKNRRMTLLLLVFKLIGPFSACATTAGEAVVEAIPKRLPPGVLVSIDGGSAGDNVASVLWALHKNPYILPTEKYTIKIGEEVCAILDTKGFPPPCSRILALLRAMNPGLLFEKRIQPNEVILLPKVSITRVRTEIVYPDRGKYNKRDSEIALRKDTWRKLKPEVDERDGGAKALTYNAYEMYFPTSSDEESESIVSALEPLRSANVLIDVLLNEPSEGKLYADVKAADYKARCLANQLTAEVLHYEDLVESDMGIDTVLEDRVRKNQGSRVPVIIIDTKLAESYHLGTTSQQASGSLGQNPQSPCNWVDFRNGIHHGNHLASLIGSRDSETGFLGLAPAADLISFVWVKPDPQGVLDVLPAATDRASQLARYIFKRRLRHEPPAVYVAATAFDDYSPSSKGPTGELLDGKRLNRQAEKQIQKSKPLLVVAAGQGSNIETDSSVMISVNTPLSPQNLGDLESVIVVTACSPTPCRRDNARVPVWAYYGQYVHVAAPGGEEIPGWVDRESMGAARGTSQAAGFTAGVIAEMIGAYDAYLGKPDLVKTRIQITSFPLSSDKVLEKRNIAAGVVDPKMALLDPEKSFVKRKRQNWQSIRVKAWSSERIGLTDRGGFVTGEDTSKVLAIHALPGPASEEPLWMVDFDLSESDSGKLGEVERKGPASFDREYYLMLCDGSKIPVRDVDTFVRRSEGGTEQCDG